MTEKQETIVIVACEQSGDNYGALLARELLQCRPELKLIGLGGPQMAAAGVQLLENMIENSATGLVEVLGSASFFIKAMKKVTAAAIEHNAACAVLIDSPDFNLRIAPKLKAVGVKVAYYVSPQLWAWRSGRVKQIRRYVDEMMVILPFEKEWYAKRGVEAAFVGHPMLDLLDLPAIRDRAAVLRPELLKDGELLIGIMPGSRRNEVCRTLPRFLDAARQLRGEFPDARFVIGCSDWLNEERVAGFLELYGELEVVAVHGKSHDVMAACDFLLCCSGTVALEAGLIGTPLLTTYLLSPLTYLAAMVLISFKQFTSLPNIILRKNVVPEHIARKLTRSEVIASTAANCIRERLPEMRSDLARIEEELGGPGASARAAERVLAISGLGATGAD